MKKEMLALEKAKQKFDICLKKLDEKARKVCDFNARIVCDCGGDGFLLLNVDTTDVAPLMFLLNYSVDHMMSESDHDDRCI